MCRDQVTGQFLSYAIFFRVMLGIIRADDRAPVFVRYMCILKLSSSRYKSTQRKKKEPILKRVAIDQ